MTIISRTLVIAFGLLTAGIASGQGLYWENTTTGISGSQAGEVSKTQAMPKMFRVTMENDSKSIIVRLDRELIYVVDNQKKSYWQMTFAQMEQVLKKANEQMQAARKQMEEAKKGMTPEQQKMMEQMLGGSSGAPDQPVSVSTASEKKTIGGYTCIKYVAKRGDQTVLTAWATKDVGEFNALRPDFNAFTKRMQSMDIGGASGVGQALEKIEGFPMRTEMGDITTVVTKLEKASVPKSTFEPPAGFMKQDPPSMDQPPRQ